MLDIKIIEKSDFYQIKLLGDLDYNYELELKTKCEVIVSQPKDTVVDLSDVKYIDSVGITVMMFLRKELVQRGFKLFFLRPSSAISKIFSMTKLDKIIPVIKDLEEISEKN